MPLFLARCCETLDGWSRSWSPRWRSSSGRATVCGIRAFRGYERTRTLVTFGLKDPREYRRGVHPLSVTRASLLVDKVDEHLSAVALAQARHTC
jgi:hypothetical protein